MVLAWARVALASHYGRYKIVLTLTSGLASGCRLAALLWEE